jgi:hypothetical protein
MHMLLFVVICYLLDSLHKIYCILFHDKIINIIIMYTTRNRATTTNNRHINTLPKENRDATTNARKVESGKERFL